MLSMELKDIEDILVSYGVGRRKLDDALFSGDKSPQRYALFDLDDEELCHEIIHSSCNVPGCKFVAQSLLEAENHYNAEHRYACGQCKKVLPSPHLLDLHIQESHDSYFAVVAAKKPSYACYIEECNEKFIDTNERLTHCVKVHKLPKDFRFDQKSKKSKKNTNKPGPMEIDKNNHNKERKIVFSNNKQKSFPKYTGMKFEKTEENSTRDVNMDDIICELKESLPS